MLAAGLSAPAGFSRACFSRRVTLISPVGRGFSLLWLASTFFLVSAGVTVLFHLAVILVFISPVGARLFRGLW